MTQTIKPIKAKKPSKTTIKPDQPLTPAKARLKSLKQHVDSAKNAAKREQEIQKKNRER